MCYSPVTVGLKVTVTVSLPPPFTETDDGETVNTVLSTLILLTTSFLSGIPHIKITGTNNSKIFFQQVQIMIFIKLKQGFFLRKSRLFWDA